MNQSSWIDLELDGLVEIRKESFQVSENLVYSNSKILNLNEDTRESGFLVIEKEDIPDI